jgi:hypothetical protein
MPSTAVSMPILRIQASTAGLALRCRKDCSTSHPMYIPAKAYHDIRTFFALVFASNSDDVLDPPGGETPLVMGLNRHYLPVRFSRGAGATAPFSSASDCQPLNFCFELDSLKSGPDLHAHTCSARPRAWKHGRSRC